MMNEQKLNLRDLESDNKINQFIFDDRYYNALAKRFPKHLKIIDKLYANYSGWIIPLADKHGIEPLEALAELDKEHTELMLPVLYKYSDIFIDIYNKLDKVFYNEGKLAGTALKLLNAFVLLPDGQHGDYKALLESAKLENSKSTALRGSDANIYAKKFWTARSCRKIFLINYRLLTRKY